jgi:ABC-type transport system involved in multi-copper enzyme maturation permease subunit
MAKITTIAACVGVLTGLSAIGARVFGLAPPQPPWSTLTLALAAVLVVDSFIALFGPKRIFYSAALLSALLVGSELIGSGSAPTAAGLLTMALAGVTLALSMVAARFEQEVSEQSNPMNLPVFG